MRGAQLGFVPWQPRASGYATRWDRRSKGTAPHVLSRGCFDESLARGDEVIFAVEHGHIPLATTRDGTLRLGSDEVGLWFAAQLPMNDLGFSVYEAIQSGRRQAMSVRYREPQFRELEAGARLVEAATLRDVSLVRSSGIAGSFAQAGSGYQFGLAAMSSLAADDHALEGRMLQFLAEARAQIALARLHVGIVRLLGSIRQLRELNAMPRPCGGVSR